MGLSEKTECPWRIIIFPIYIYIEPYPGGYTLFLDTPKYQIIRDKSQHGIPVTPLFECALLKLSKHMLNPHNWLESAATSPWHPWLLGPVEQHGPPRTRLLPGGMMQIYHPVDWEW